jgi:hypothetical protein
MATRPSLEGSSVVGYLISGGLYLFELDREPGVGSFQLFFNPFCLPERELASAGADFEYSFQLKFQIKKFP